MEYTIPAMAFILLVLASWESITKSRKITPRGWAILVIGALTLFFGVRKYLEQQTESRALVDRIALEARRLHPQDFAFRLEATQSAPVRPPSERLLGRDHVSDSLQLSAFISYDKDSAESDDKHRAEVWGVWTLLKPARDPSHSPSETFQYVGRDFVLAGLDNFPYIDSLAGKVIRIYVPRGQIEFGFRSWTYTVEVVVRGHKFKGKLGKSDVIEIRIPDKFPEV
jgi:hypothetical protein